MHWPTCTGTSLGSPEWNFSHFRLLHQNYWDNFNNTWHKLSCGEEDSSFFTWSLEGPHPFPRGDNNKIAKMHWLSFKIFSSRTTEPVSIHLHMQRFSAIVSLHNPLTKVATKSWASIWLVPQSLYGTNYWRSFIA